MGAQLPTPKSPSSAGHCGIFLLLLARPACPKDRPAAMWSLRSPRAGRAWSGLERPAVAPGPGNPLSHRGGERTIECTSDVFQNGTPESYITLLTSVSPIRSIKKETKQNTTQPSFLEEPKLEVPENSATSSKTGRVTCCPTEAPKLLPHPRAAQRKLLPHPRAAQRKLLPHPRAAQRKLRQSRPSSGCSENRWLR